MIIITFPSLYIIYGLIINLVCLTVILAQYYNSEKVLHYLCSFCAICAIYVPIFLKYYSPWTVFADALVSIFSAVTGFLFALKIIELAFTYEWTKQKQITIKQILIDFSTFPKYKYEPEPPLIK
jgi:Co/Zn/Cd efflux system component